MPRGRLRIARAAAGVTGLALKAACRALRAQPVLVVAGVAAVLSMAFVAPSAAYADYIDVRVLGLLFGLMLCVGGLQRSGFFAWLAHVLVRHCSSLRAVSAVLVMLAFFASMFVTNDVALITFVPLAILVLRAAGCASKLAYVVVLQTIAANMGSMVTPFGNPQNLFLYEAFDIPPLDFMLCLAPYAALAFVLLMICVMFTGSTPMSPRVLSESRAPDARRTAGFAALFALCVLAVLHVVPLGIVLVMVCAVSLALDREAFRQVDYALLATFVCFFVFSGNLMHVEGVADAVASALGAYPFAVALGASQVISNVPAAVLLAPFADTWQPLLLGVDVGGLGTPVASLASLISLNLYRRCSETDSTGRYLAVFTAANGGFLVALCALRVILA